MKENKKKYYESCIDTTDEVLNFLWSLQEDNFEKEVLDKIIEFVDELNFDYVQLSIKEQ